MHRLTRVEYDNTVQDLLGEPSSVLGALPPDQVNALGYDNDGLSLMTSPLLVEDYSTLGAQLGAQLMGRLHPYSQSFTIVPSPVWGMPCTSGSLTPGVDMCGEDADWYMNNPSTGFFGVKGYVMGAPETTLEVDQVPVPLSGSYTFSVTAFSIPVMGCSVNPCQVKLQVLIDTDSFEFDVTNVPPSSPKTFTMTDNIIAGLHSIQVRSEFLDTASGYQVELYVSNMHLDATPVPPGLLPVSQVVDCGGAPANSDECTTNMFTKLLPRAWRRPVSAAEVAAIKGVSDTVTKDPMATGAADEVWRAGTALAVQATLLSPNFLYRIETDPDPTSTTPHALDDYALASRLSYFLWSSMPDDELFARAKAGTLHVPATLDTEIERMLNDPKVSRLVQNFAGQWLGVRDFAAVAKPDPTTFPNFTADVQTAMLEETSLYFQSFLAAGAKVPDLMDSNFTFVNQALATYYGLPNPPSGTDFVRVTLDPSTHRAGVLGQGSVLTLTSFPTRTSPAHRGKYVLTQLACSPPGIPPPGVPPIESESYTGSMRHRMEVHATHEPCASCHEPALDPVGFAMENFDGVGVYRTMDGQYPVDTSGLTLYQKPITDIASLQSVLKDGPYFLPCFALQLFSYAIGQEGEYAADGPTISSILSSVQPGGYALRDMIHAFVKSKVFTTRAGGGE
jgi:Protein of unknown function (DUF1592)/Protein of unknown function (DUF1588)/Protein of unknown function (DUF1587)/Protein of unknown function (DUF1595)/Protein of unknown function (DUF1585)